jgi:uncharacterized repeat protein (TIGR03803 family)
MYKGFAVLSGIVWLLALVVLAKPTESVLYEFTGGSDGILPNGGLIADKSGNLYGTTLEGGSYTLCPAYGCGTVFELTPSGAGWSETILHTFAGGNDGEIPREGLVADKHGNLYGTTGNGGYWSAGTVFELTPSDGGWTETIIYDFPRRNDGYVPAGALILDGKGNLYGTTEYGGGEGSGIECDRGCGTIFKLTPVGSVWQETILYRFTGGTDGANPLGSLAMDSSGNLYSTASAGGNFTSDCNFYGCGAVIELTRSGGNGIASVIYDFTGAHDGATPLAGAILDREGNLYGTTSEGGDHFNGNVFEFSPSGGVWQESVLYTFCSKTDCGDGAGPKAVVFSGKGNIYGTTGFGGIHNFGAVFELISSEGGWKEKTYELPGGHAGAIPTSGVLLKDQFLLGTAEFGGNTQDCSAQDQKGCGLVYQLNQ